MQPLKFLGMTADALLEKQPTKHIAFPAEQTAIPAIQPTVPPAILTTLTKDGIVHVQTELMIPEVDALPVVLNAIYVIALIAILVLPTTLFSPRTKIVDADQDITTIRPRV